MKRTIELVYQGAQVRCGLSTKYKHYRVTVDGADAGWVIPGLYGAYSNEAECLGHFHDVRDAALAIAEHYIHFL